MYGEDDWLEAAYEDRNGDPYGYDYDDQEQHYIDLEYEL